MSRAGIRWRPLLCVLAVALGVAGCTSSSADGPTSSSSLTIASASVIDTSTASAPATASSPGEVSTPSVGDVPTASSAPPSALDPAAQEAVDRRLIESQWVAFWNVYDAIVRTPKDQRAAALAAVAVPPVSDNILEAADQADIDGIDNYGPVTHRLSWQFSIDGASTATIADCQDQSQAGTIKISTGEKGPPGQPRSNMRGLFNKGTDGVWRLSQLFFLEATC